MAHRPPLLTRVLAGAAAGLAATAAMSASQLALTRRPGAAEPAPEELTERAAHRAGVHVPDPADDAVSALSHLFYGTVAGVLFAVLRPPAAVPAGTIYGAALAVLGYQGWVPATGLMPPLSRASTPRQQEIVVSHLVYGAVLGALTARLTRSPR